MQCATMSAAEHKMKQFYRNAVYSIMDSLYSADRLMIEGVQKGDEQAFRTFIEQYKRLVSHIVFRMIDNPHDREDICQEVFIKAIKNIDNFKFQSKLSAWIGKIAVNSCLNHQRKLNTPIYNNVDSEDDILDSLTTSYLTPDNLLERKDISVRLETAIATLPDTCRTIITLFHLDEMSYSQIGEIMGLPEGTVKSYLFRGRSKLKSILMHYYEIGDFVQ